ncbi:FeoA family protein [Ochrovirga pacifica]|uniref:FeoA family protein n=1 Tax=Ochrovirga pacifica TaxID=1042376 RepID=UPI0002557BB7|nr:FeoA family protein [Ochrovirga pacifica]
MKIHTVADLQRGERAIIKSYQEDIIPLKLIEMGCIEGNYIEVLQRAPMQDPLYINISGTYVAIRLEMATKIWVEKI